MKTITKFVARPLPLDDPLNAVTETERKLILGLRDRAGWWCGDGRALIEIRSFAATESRQFVDAVVKMNDTITSDRVLIDQLYQTINRLTQENESLKGRTSAA
jgi:hypothetical protein